MPQSRRNFLKKAALLAAGTGVTNMQTASIARAMAINADKGTTFYDAEHIVLLMQENRSFDHIFGCLKGVRGFNDPKAKRLPNGNRVWIQDDGKGQSVAPFHLDIHKTKITWQGGLPHGWKDQSLARNNGKYDAWIPHKTPMTMGYYDRNDMPFYYALADAFTICDHHFCSSLTGTTPNRLFYWTGNVRPQPDGNSVPVVNNSQAESRKNTFVDWTSYPEILEDNDISWKIYQNEVWTANLEDEKDYWLGNYGDNAIEYVKRHQVKLSAYFRKNGDATVTPALSAQEVLDSYNKLSQKEKNLIDKAFNTNIELEDYLELEAFRFKNDRGGEEAVNIPKDDIFHCFRKDVENGELPTVSWLVAPQSFSDHTSSPFYGTWYVSQILDILTQNPEVWRKTIFIINYDENDGYFDHIPPFVVPGGSTGGKLSNGIDSHSDFATKEQWPIGLGYRVPMIIASPWSKGGFVNSEICDHTSTLMFLEKFLQKKTGKNLHCANISSWRRAVCGDLTSAFRPYKGEVFPLPEFLQKEKVITDIQNAKNKPEQGVPFLSAKDKKLINDELAASPVKQQEKGVRMACSLPYKFHVSCQVNKNSLSVGLKFHAEKFDGAKGTAFNMYAGDSYKNNSGNTWAYAVTAGDVLHDQLDIDGFPGGVYDLHIDGANGFYRHFAGDKNDPELEINFEYGSRKLFGNKNAEAVTLQFLNHGEEPVTFTLKDNSYGKPSQKIEIKPGKKERLQMNLSKSFGWYDFTLTADGFEKFSKRFAGHVETGSTSFSDPHMGGLDAE